MTDTDAGSSAGASAESAAGAGEAAGEAAKPAPTTGTKAETTPTEAEYELEFDDKDDKGQPTKTKAKFKASELRDRIVRGATHENENKRYSSIMKALEDRVGAVRGDPKLLKEFAKEFGFDYDKAVHAYAMEQVELGKLTPEQRKARETEQALADYKKREEDFKRQSEQKQLSEAVQKRTATIYENLGKELDAAGLPKDPAIQMIATGHMRHSLINNKEPDIKAAVAYAKNLISGLHKSHLKGLTYDQLEKDHPELLTMVREGDIKKVKEFSGRSPPAPRNAPRKTEKHDEQISASSWMRELNKP